MNICNKTKTELSIILRKNEILIDKLFTKSMMLRVLLDFCNHDEKKYISKYLELCELAKNERQNICRELGIRDNLSKIEITTYIINGVPLPTINKSISDKDINIEDIDLFYCVGTKSQNEILNKKREKIIQLIINKKIPDKFYMENIRWNTLREQVFEYVYTIAREHKIDNVVSCYCNHMGGRKNVYDFMVNINECIDIKVEFKYNVISVDKCPQFVSPSKPSPFLTNHYEEYFYDNYLLPSLTDEGILIPDRDEYLKTINNNKPACVEHLKTYCKKNPHLGIKLGEQFKKSVELFILNTELLIDVLSDYLIDKQKDKHYMLYKDGQFYYEHIKSSSFKIMSYTKGKNYYLVKTVGGFNLKILLRWKNGNGIAFPAFQISLHK
jgi:hypothetical protein